MNLESAKQIVSEGVGFKMGMQLKEDKMLDHDIILKGIESVLSGASHEPDVEHFQKAALLLQEEATKVAQAEGDAFLLANKCKEGMQVTESGLQYQILEEGNGDCPQPTDRVSVHYQGTLIDGTVFDSSIKRGTPADFGVTQVIPGWVEGLQLMKPGSRYKFFIPQNLAYGEQGSGRTIPPYAALVFEVELISIL